MPLRRLARRLLSIPAVHFERVTTMRKRLAFATAAALTSLGLFASSSNAAGTFCYDVKVNAGGQEVVNQAGCQELPA